MERGEVCIVIKKALVEVSSSGANLLAFFGVSLPRVTLQIWPNRIAPVHKSGPRALYYAHLIPCDVLGGTILAPNLRIG